MSNEAKKSEEKMYKVFVTYKLTPTHQKTEPVGFTTNRELVIKQHIDYKVIRVCRDVNDPDHEAVINTQEFMIIEFKPVNTKLVIEK